MQLALRHENTKAQILGKIVLFLRSNIANNIVHAEQDVAAKKSFGACRRTTSAFAQDEKTGDIAPKHGQKTQDYLMETALAPRNVCDSWHSLFVGFCVLVPLWRSVSSITKKN